MKKTLSILIVSCIIAHAYSQNYGDYRLYADINFENGTADDSQGNSQVVLLNGATVTTDADRTGKVLYCPSATKGALKFNNSPLHDQMTISFWFKRQDSSNTNWRMMFSFTAANGSKVYFTPHTTWSESSYLVYDNQAYNVYKTVIGQVVTNNQWIHYALVFADNTVTVYQDGEQAGSITMVTKLSDINANQWFFGNDPNQNFPMEGKIDDIKIFHSVLSPNQIRALKAQVQLPEPVDESAPVAWLPFNDTVSDAMGAITPVATAVSYANNTMNKKHVVLTENSSIAFGSECLGSDKFSISLLIKKETFGDAADGKEILKFKADNGDYYGVRIFKSASQYGLQLVKRVNGSISVEANSTRYLTANQWNSVVFIQTFSSAGTAAIRIYVNGASGLLKTNLNIHSISPSTCVLGSGEGNSLACEMDELKVFQRELSASGISAFHQSSLDPVVLTINPKVKFQTIANFGSSDAWNAQPVGLYFTLAKKEKLAELLFSQELDSAGNPKGIGLSSWRFNIGAGTFEQGTASRIEQPERRTECFLNNDGTWNWNKQAGQRWFLEKAALTYQVPDIIGWQNSPPVQFTVRGLGFREKGDPKQSILKTDKYNAFGDFLADVILHFKDQGINFKYISPLNEPQHDWTPDTQGGTFKQEGTPWTNQEIKNVLQAIDSRFALKNIDSKLFVTEAGNIGALLSGTGVAQDQINQLWKTSGSNYIGNISSLSKIISAHSYWDDTNDNTIVSQRSTLNTRISQLASGYQYWQTEYSLLGTGYQWGHPADRQLTPMECGISLARIIHNDLAVGNATGWQWWSTFELEKNTGAEDRFALIPVAVNSTQTDGVFRTTKLLYTLGNYSRFIRPGMKRVQISRSDNKTDTQAVSSQMISAYMNEESSEFVIVAVNASLNECGIKLKINNLSEELIPEGFVPYVTTNNPEDNLKKYPNVYLNENFILPPTSIVTFVSKMDVGTKIPSIASAAKTVSIAPNPADDFIQVHIQSEEPSMSIQLIDLAGKVINRVAVSGQTKDLQIPVSHLDAGLYLLKTTFTTHTELNKIIIKH